MTEVQPCRQPRSRWGGCAALPHGLATGRATLDADELARLLAAADLHTTTAPADAIELSIRVHATRVEFGLVLSAGTGGPTRARPANFARPRGGACGGRAHRRRGLPRAFSVARSPGSASPPSPPVAAHSPGTRRSSASSRPRCSWPRAACPTPRARRPPCTSSCSTAPATARYVQVLAARCGVGAPAAARGAPAPQDRPPLHPERIGIVGASASGMNFGRIILRNLLGSGCPPERLCVIRPAAADRRRRLHREPRRDRGQARPADRRGRRRRGYPLVDEIIAAATVEAVMLIPGGLGETAKSREPAAALAARINAAHARDDGGRSSSAPTASAWSRTPGATIPGSSRSSACPSRRRRPNGARSC